MEEYLKEKHKHIFNSFLVILGIFLISITILKIIDIQDKLQEAENTITITESSQIYAKPDLALGTFSVVTEAKTVTQALTDNTNKMNALISFIKNQGVEERDIKTTSFNISPRYEWRESLTCYPPCPGNTRVLVGYEISQSLEVKIRDMLKIGETIQGATEAGANQVSNLQFVIDKQEEFKKQAREEAIKKAKVKAQELASQLGIKLIRISNFSEGVSTPFFYDMREAVGMGGAIPAPAPEIATGENKIEVTVSLTYQVK